MSESNTLVLIVALGVLAFFGLLLWAEDRAATKRADRPRRAPPTPPPFQWTSSHYFNGKPVTDPAQREAMDKAFTHVDDAFDDMNRAFDAMSKATRSEPNP